MMIIGVFTVDVHILTSCMPNRLYYFTSHPCACPICSPGPLYFPKLSNNDLLQHKPPAWSFGSKGTARTSFLTSAIDSKVINTSQPQL
jgi:hypothetical protein